MTSGSASSRYETLEVIGSGGMATVWKARDRDLGRFVALKRPHPSPDDSVVAARFRREAQSAAAVSHPNLVTVYDVGTDDDGPYLVMELLDAPSLAETTVPRDQIHRVGTEIASGLVALHASGIVHRDIKPGNILLADGGAQLTDFGIARSLHNAETLTQVGTTFATPAYAAPEVVSGGQYTEASDVYALAAVLRELVAGRRIVPNDATQVMVTDPTWRPVLDPALSSEPAARPTAAEFLATLRGADAAATVPIVTPQVPPVIVEPGGIAPLGGPQEPPILPAMIMRDDDRPGRNPVVIFAVLAVLLGVIVLVFAATRDDGSPFDEVLGPDSALDVDSTTPADTAEPTTPPAATEAPAAAPEPESTAPPVDDVAAARADLENFVSEISGGPISDKEADKLIADVTKLIDDAATGNERELEKRLDAISSRIEDKIDDDVARQRATDLLDVLLVRLGIDPGND